MSNTTVYECTVGNKTIKNKEMTNFKSQNNGYLGRGRGRGESYNQNGTQE